MSSVEAARPSVAVSIRTSDPLQQTQRPAARRSGAGVDRRHAARETPQSAGILGQLATERAHD